MDALITALVLWLAAAFDLPPTVDHPEIRFASAEALAALHFRGLLTPSGAKPAATDGATLNSASDIIAAYDTRTQTIYLLKGWRGETPTEVSMLVHEMVHHLQQAAGVRHECPQARERLAYEAQEAWLNFHGESLQSAFGIDGMSLLVRTRCLF